MSTSGFQNISPLWDQQTCLNPMPQSSSPQLSSKSVGLTIRPPPGFINTDPSLNPFPQSLQFMQTSFQSKTTANITCIEAANLIGQENNHKPYQFGNDYDGCSLVNDSSHLTVQQKDATKPSSSSILFNFIRPPSSSLQLHWINIIFLLSLLPSEV